MKKIKGFKYYIVVLFILLGLFGYKYWLINIKKDILIVETEKFRNIDYYNDDKNMCTNFEIDSFKQKCIDNFSSIFAFKNLDERLCKKIKSKELIYPCERSIILFNVRNSLDSKKCDNLKKEDIAICIELIKNEKESLEQRNRINSELKKSYEEKNVEEDSQGNSCVDFSGSGSVYNFNGVNNN